MFDQLTMGFIGHYFWRGAFLLFYPAMEPIVANSSALNSSLSIAAPKVDRTYCPCWDFLFSLIDLFFIVICRFYRLVSEFAQLMHAKGFVAKCHHLHQLAPVQPLALKACFQDFLSLIKCLIISCLESHPLWHFGLIFLEHSPFWSNELD